MVLLMVSGAFLTACATIISQEKSLPLAHPEELAEKRVLCSECHEDQAKGSLKALTTFSHTPVFVKEHRLYAMNSERLCSVCHATSFCNDCHATKNELKPSQKIGNRPDRELMHRGDFMTLHRIEGKLDPASCYRCHGRGNNELCRNCHR
jgi:hypothetical protein